MPSTREIRRRIRSVKNIAQITKAKQMVASSKMRRAQERVQQARPYADQLRDLVSRLSLTSGVDIGEGVDLMKERPVRNIGIVAHCRAISTAKLPALPWSNKTGWRNRASVPMFTSSPLVARAAILLCAPGNA